jgi:hypothetical protein
MARAVAVVMALAAAAAMQKAVAAVWLADAR